MIKPENKHRYPKNWKEISKKLIEEKGKCEICGRTRDEIHLTVHHKNRMPEDNRIENLIVLCPRCHFNEERLINIGVRNNSARMELF